MTNYCLDVWCQLCQCLMVSLSMVHLMERDFQVVPDISQGVGSRHEQCVIGHENTIWSLIGFLQAFFVARPTPLAHTVSVGTYHSMSCHLLGASDSSPESVLCHASVDLFG